MWGGGGGSRHDPRGDGADGADGAAPRRSRRAVPDPPPRRKAEKGFYKEAAEHWDLALALNPLHADGWFALSHACMKLGELERAVAACTRCVQLDAEGFEGWNNLAALLMAKGKEAEAFSALQVAVKLKRNSWQTQENLARTGIAVGEHFTACCALAEVLKISGGERLEAELLSGVVEGLAALGERVRRDEAAASESASVANDAEGGAPPAPAGDGDDWALLDAVRALAGAQLEGDDEAGDGAGPDASGWRSTAHDAVGRSRMLAQLGRRVGELLRTASASASTSVQTPAYWSVAGRYWEVMGETRSEKECLFKCVRGLSTSTWRKDARAFEDLAQASLRLAECSLRLAEADPGVAGRELTTVRMQLAGLHAGAAREYPDHELTGRLAACLARVQAMRESLG